ncbi:MAG: tRNA (uridine(34)/cytosine(34)/5-carboxymethylaminomethyluridine(34)-2'-O)-methyltransferase TrmL [Anaerofustis sp.]
MFHIVLFQPQIPQNTGNIARTCAVTESELHLIRPYGFQITDRSLKRAGLDYWDFVSIHEYENFNEFFISNSEKRMFLMTTHAVKPYTQESYQDGDCLIFGSETSGVTEEIHEKLKEFSLRIPMRAISNARCLNLSNSVAVVLYEALRQNNFLNLM